MCPRYPPGGGRGHHTRGSLALALYLLEESYEALEALESGDERAVREELGDVLMQPVFHARVAAGT